MFKRALQSYRDILILCIAASVIGVIVGMLDAGFGEVLLWITGQRERHPFLFIPFLPLAGALMIGAYQKAGKNCLKGMGLVFQVRFREEREIPLRLIPFTIVSTWATHLFGGSAGREGVAVQIGATVAHGIGSRLRVANASEILLVAGMAAGFAGLFQTPIAAVFFALEVLVAGVLDYEALLTALTASVIAAKVSHFMGLEKFSVPLDLSIHLTLAFCVKLLVVGLAFGITGGIFARSLKKLKEVTGGLLQNPIHKIAVMGAAVGLFSLLIHAGRYSGLGTNLIQSCFGGGAVYPYDWIVKLVFTIVTLAAGFQGGEVTPLFSIGASLGLVLGDFLNLPAAFIAALGYAGVFSGATNTFIAPVFIGAEVFGFQYLPYFFVVCAIAHVVSGSQSIYPAQRKHRLEL
ncbi:chloride channel protein [uncultured Robinsoniella sp.]|uniref:chloride channel protein n=1 Tax=uncultured Robinsoniella sp. TaxID=904190 RepID=UPI00374ED42E